MIKKILSMTLVLTLVFALSAQSIFAQPKGRPNKEKNEKTETVEMNNEDENTLEASDVVNDLKMMLSFGTEGWTNLPSGLAKRENLPPGLEKLRLQNRLPFGLAKRLEGYEKPEKEETDLLEVLTETIEEARVLLNTKEDVLYTEEGIATFTESILVLEGLLENFEDQEETLITDGIQSLKEAMKTFKLQVVLGEESYTSLTELYEALIIYGDLYFEDPDQMDEDDAFYNDYKTLMASLQAVLIENSEIILTKELYNELIQASKAFKNHNEALLKIINEAKSLLFVDLDEEVLVYKYHEGSEPGDLVIGSNVELYKNIKIAENALETLEVYDYENLKLEKEALISAMEIFKNNIYLGEPAILTLVNIQTLLEARYEDEASDPLMTLINKIKVYTSVENKYITTGNFNLILTESQDYIDALFVGMKDGIESFISEKQVTVEAITIKDSLDFTAYDLAVTEAEAYIVLDEAWTFTGLNEAYALLEEKWQLVLDQASTLLNERVGAISFEILDSEDEALLALNNLIDEVILYLGEENIENMTLEGMDDYYVNLNILFADYEASLIPVTTGE
jgi:hypothetical protein